LGGIVADLPSVEQVSYAGGVTDADIASADPWAFLRAATPRQLGLLGLLREGQPLPLDPDRDHDTARRLWNIERGLVADSARDLRARRRRSLHPAVKHWSAAVRRRQGIEDAWEMTQGADGPNRWQVTKDTRAGLTVGP
jgi:hypothetical protein